MNFDLSEEQTLFQTTVQRFVADVDVARRAAVRRHPGGIDPARWATLAELGLLALPASADHGGLGGEIIDCVVASEALGRGVAPDPWLEAAYWPLRLLEGLDGGGGLSERIASGEVRAAVAFAEPGRRYDLTPKTVRAARRGDGWALSGTKRAVFAGEGCDVYLIIAEAEGKTGVFAVSAPAVQARAHTVVDGGRAVELTLKDAIAEHAFWPGPDALADAVAETRLVAAAEMVGLAGRLFDETLAYVRQREQFGQAIGRFQVIQHRLVDAYARLEQMRSLLWGAVLHGRDADGGWRDQAAGAKGFIAEGAIAIGHEAIQLHGGMGVTEELIVSHAHKRVLLLSKLFGDPASDLRAFAKVA